MIERFQFFADRAEENGLKLVVGLITGWMSGRLFVPPALEGRNVLIDPMAIQWVTRLVRYFVKHFKTHQAIAAWDLGNECNVMADMPSREAAWAWSSAITNTIRVEDPTRPVVSGMHSLSPARSAEWTMQDQGELTDLLTTHPYPYFTPHCDQDPINSLRTILHSTAESRFYADIGGKPCIAEEIGTLGPMIASEAVAADFARSALFSLWAHDCHGMLWWCAYDQILLEHAPYDWASFERELGLARSDRSEKPVMGEIGEFGNWLKSLPFTRLPGRLVEAVCILTEEQDAWGAAYASFVLAKQAGFDLEFQYVDQPIKPARLYLLPSVGKGGAMSRRTWFELLRRVEEDGAVLYLSHDDCLLSPFNQAFGLEVQTREKRTAPADFTLTTPAGEWQFTCASSFRLAVKATRAEILGNEPDGNPVFTCATFGQGKIYFLSVPIERYLSETPGSFTGAQAQPFWWLYRETIAGLSSGRIVRRDNAQVGVTEHVLQPDKRVVVMINYSPETQATETELDRGWKISTVYYGEAPVGSTGKISLKIAKNDALVFLMEEG
jgi:hypothetical protein